MNPTEQQNLAERIADKLLFISGINQPAKLVFPGINVNQLAGPYNRADLIDLILSELRQTPA